jgi:hypothetical protein
VIGLPRKRRVRLTRQSCLMLAAELIVLILAIWRLGIVVFPSSDDDGNPTRSLPTNLSQGLTFADALPTLTPDASVPQRIIAFPGASISAPIVPAGRVQGTWETRHLGESVGHLVGTSWLNGAGGNIVLAGHVESATGAPGPFAHLLETFRRHPHRLRRTHRRQLRRPGRTGTCDANHVHGLGSRGQNLPGTTGGRCGTSGYHCPEQVAQGLTCRITSIPRRMPTRPAKLRDQTRNARDDHGLSSAICFSITVRVLHHVAPDRSRRHTSVE